LLALGLVAWQRCGIEPGPPALDNEDLAAVETQPVRTERPRLPPKQPATPAVEAPVAQHWPSAWVAPVRRLFEQGIATLRSKPPEPPIAPAAMQFGLLEQGASSRGRRPKLYESPRPPRRHIVVAVPRDLPHEPAARIERLLDTPLTLDVAEAQLEHVVTAINEPLGAEIVAVEKLVAAPAGPGLEGEPVWLRCQRAPLRLVLDLLATQTERHWEVDAHGVLFHAWGCDSIYSYPEIYPLDDLASLRVLDRPPRPYALYERPPKRTHRSLDETRQAAWNAILQTVAPPGQEVRASLLAPQGVRMLCLTADYRWHAAVRRLLAELRAAAAGGLEAAPRQADPSLQAAARLNRTVSVDLPVATLVETVERLAAMGEIGVAWDDAAIAVYDIAMEQTPTPALCGTMSLRAALRQVLRPLQLCYELRDGTLIITTYGEMDGQAPTARVYPLGDLLPRPGEGWRFDAAALADMIASCVAPTTWSDVGGPGEMVAAELNGEPLLVIAQNSAHHAEVTNLLGALRRAVRDAAAGRLQPSYRCGLPTPPAEQAIEEALARRVTLSFQAVPLCDAIRQVGREQKINVAVDGRGLDDVGLEPTTPITFRANDISLRSALKLMLRDLGLSYLIEDEQLVITSREEADLKLVPVVYPVEDVVKVLAHSKYQSGDCDALTEFISSAVNPTTWDDVGGPGQQAVVCCRGVLGLVIVQTPPIHAEIEQLLGTLREIAVEAARGRPAAEYPLIRQTPSQRALAAALTRRVTLRFDNEPMAAVIERISQQCGVCVVLESSPDKEDQWLRKTRISGRVEDAPLGDALQSLLRDVGLTYTVRSDYLSVASLPDKSQDWATRFYWVDDLLGPSPRRGKPTANRDDLTAVIHNAVYPNGWDDVGGPNSMEPVYIGDVGFLLVSQTEALHAETRALLATLRSRLKP
jgi:hypothetical protein